MVDEDVAPTTAETPMPWEHQRPRAQEWTDTALEKLRSGSLNVRVSDRRRMRSIVATGDCPRCGHDVAYSESLDAPVPKMKLFRLDGGASEKARVFIYCECDGEHPDQPVGSTGCGITFAVLTVVHQS